MQPLARTLFLLMFTFGCAGRVVVDPGDGSDGSANDAGIDWGDAPFCDNDAALGPGYCPSGWHCDVYDGGQHTWNVCCPPTDAGEGCVYPSQ